MKKICSLVAIIIVVTFCISIVFADALERTNLESEHAIALLKKIGIINGDCNFQDIASRKDCLKMLVDIDGGPREVADFFLMETADAYQDIEPQCEDLPYLYTATEVLGIFVGKLDDQGQLIAALEEPLTWNDALFMCMRMICGGEGVFDPIYRDGLNRDINFLINYAQRNGCINYNLNGEIGLKVQYDDLSNAVTMRELCMLVYRILQTPIVANAMGGPYTKYLIDNFIK